MGEVGKWYRMIRSDRGLQYGVEPVQSRAMTVPGLWVKAMAEAPITKQFPPEQKMKHGRLEFMQVSRP